MNTALAAATVVGDRCSRQHVTHRSNQQVRAEEVFSYPRIPQNPHTLPTATTFEFSWEKSMWETFSWRDDRNKSSSRRTAGGTEREADMMLTLSLNREKKVVFKEQYKNTVTKVQMTGYPSCPLPAFGGLDPWEVLDDPKKSQKKQTKKTLSYF